MGLAERRRAVGYSQETLAHLLGVDRTTVGRWESGRVFPQPPQRRGLANALGLSLDELDCLPLGSRRPLGARPRNPRHRESPTR
ncbi:helix-turn-helix transcriptional regulator [Streptomyces albidoflavus]|uniref:helix-turn-helix transcriptional regulator n=1 Tax=Streptomyces albidoflavus TaxID=1886 RepID=UPI001E555A75|nr:helix-turn-helix transcriptional regulator [Streptomyces albidoflavus]